MRRFQLNRKIDISGVSGTGIVAEGVQFSNGVVTITWVVNLPTVEVHQNITSVTQIHGHEGSTALEWIDDE